MEFHETRLRVRYAETDQMGIVYHANYLVWMEVGRVEYCRAAGLAYRDFERDAGMHMAVVEANCRYRLPARYDDLVSVRTRIRESNPRMVVFGYEMLLDGSDSLLADGFTRHVFLDARSLKPRKLPENYRHIFI